MTPCLFIGIDVAEADFVVTSRLVTAPPEGCICVTTTGRTTWPTIFNGDRVLGIKSSRSFVREPEGNGVAERFIRTLKPRCDATSSAWTQQRNPPPPEPPRASAVGVRGSRVDVCPDPDTAHEEFSTG